MRKRFDLYGSSSLPPEEAARLIESAVGLLMDPHESSFHGGDYYYRGTGDAVSEVVVQSNFEDEEGYLAEPDFPSQITLIYVSEPSPEVTARLRDVNRLTLLRTEFV